MAAPRTLSRRGFLAAGPAAVALAGLAPALAPSNRSRAATRGWD